MKILHVEAGKHLYGGARQVLYIVEGLAARGVTNLLACPAGSEIARQQPAGTRVVAMKMGGDGDLGMVSRLASLIRAERPGALRLARVMAERPRYINLVVLLRIACEAAATVLLVIEVPRSACTTCGTPWTAKICSIISLANTPDS